MITCTFENGNKTSLRHVVVDNLIVRNNQILLVKRASHVINAGKYAFVGGFVGRDETIEEAALREIKEETGYTSKISYLFRIIDSPKRPQEDRQNVSFVFVVEPIEKEGEGDEESTDVNWFSLDNLPKPEEFAFDHYQNIELFLRYQKEPFKLPLFERKKF